MGQIEKTPDQNFDERPNDELGTGLTILSFCVPIAGAVIYLSNKSDCPNKAKSACHAALWGMLVGFILNIISYVIGGSV